MENGIKTWTDVPYARRAGHIQLAPAQGILVVSVDVIPVPKIPGDFLVTGEVKEPRYLTVDAVVVETAVIDPTAGDVGKRLNDHSLRQIFEIAGDEGPRNGDLSDELIPVVPHRIERTWIFIRIVRIAAGVVRKGMTAVRPFVSRRIGKRPAILEMRTGKALGAPTRLRIYPHDRRYNHHNHRRRSINSSDIEWMPPCHSTGHATLLSPRIMRGFPLLWHTRFSFVRSPVIGRRE